MGQQPSNINVNKGLIKRNNPIDNTFGSYLQMKSVINMDILRKIFDILLYDIFRQVFIFKGQWFYNLPSYPTNKEIVNNSILSNFILENKIPAIFIESITVSIFSVYGNTYHRIFERKNTSEICTCGWRIESLNYQIKDFKITSNDELNMVKINDNFNKGFYRQFSDACTLCKNKAQRGILITDGKFKIMTRCEKNTWIFVYKAMIMN